MCECRFSLGRFALDCQFPFPFICNLQFEIISRIMLLIIGKRMIGICKKIENNSDDMIREVHEVARNFLCMNELNLVDC